MRSTRSLAVAVALAATGLSIVAPTAAFAGTVAAPSAAVVSAASASLIDPNAPTELDIHKFLGAPTNQPANGTAQTVTGVPPLSGVVFDVYQVANVDLTTNAGWTAATDLQGVSLTAADIAAGSVKGKSGTSYALTKVSSVTTDATGTAKYTGGKVGLYVVNENLTASTTVTNTATGAVVPTNTITPAAPFAVTLPMTQPTDLNSWMYTVNVYPKNSSDTITKTVADQGTISTGAGTTANADHTLDYTLTGSITPGIDGATMGTYVIADQLPKGTTFDSIVSVKAGSTALVAGTDYTVYSNGSTTIDKALDGPMIQVVMTPAGLDKVAAAKAADPAAAVTVVLRAIGTAATGDLNNTAYLIPSNAWWATQDTTPSTPYTPGTDNPGGGVPSNEVDTHLGSATLTKQDGADATPLANAVFDLYSMVIPRTDMLAPKAADCTNVVADAANLKMTGLTTDAAGSLTMKGLQQSDYWNSTTQSTQKIVYCLVETKAPQGYNLNAEPTAFFMTNTGTAPAVNVTAAVTVKDEKSNLSNNLPLTGGAGASALGLGGLAVVGATLAARAASRKRREDEDAELV